jgi:hypothetical protein
VTYADDPAAAYSHGMSDWQHRLDRFLDRFPRLAVGPLRGAPFAVCGVSLVVRDDTVPDADLDALDAPLCPVCVAYARRRGWRFPCSS